VSVEERPEERLRWVAARLGELGADGEWLAGVMQRYLDPFAGCTLDQAAGLLPAAGAEHWRTAARRALRDAAIRTLADYFPGPRTAAAEEIGELLTGYATTRWKVDRARPTMPETYAGTQRAYLYAALVAGGGRVLGDSRIYQILATRSGIFIASDPGDNCPHGTPTDHRRDERR
jgi:hypothetical protein